MSDIYGNGWGDDHDWKRGGTNQVGNNWAAKASYYRCANCSQSFAHSYDVIPDIFQNMQHVGISEHCPKLPAPTYEIRPNAKCDICGSTAIDHTEQQCSMNRQLKPRKDSKPL